jgi:integrase
VSLKEVSPKALSWNVRRARKLLAQRQAYVAENVARISAVNRPELEVHVREYRNRCRETSVQKFVHAVMQADEILGMDFRAIDAESARRLIAGLRSRYSERSVRPMAILARQHIRWLFGVDRLDEQGSPVKDGKAIERALRVPRQKMKVVGQVLSASMQDRLVSALPVRSSLNPPFPMEVRDRWCLRGLKAAGDRISKFCALRLRDVRIELGTVNIHGKPTKVPLAWLGVDFEAADLKTTVDSATNGERFLWQHVDDLIAWLKVHPCVGITESSFDWLSFNGARDAADPEAPLNLRASCGGIQGISPFGIAKIITLASKASGLDRELPAKLTPHDFRHTGATEDARNGDSEFDLRMKYDWGTDSKMPGVYVHLNLDDMRRRALEKAQAAQVEPAPAIDVQAALRAVQTFAAALQGVNLAPAVPSA